jgi:hypothetical protein
MTSPPFFKLTPRDARSQLLYGRPALRILFVPWPVGESDLHQTARQWMGGAKTPTLWTPYTGNEDSVMARLTGMDVVYLLGHGRPGAPELWPERSLRGTPLHMKQVAGRLLHSGLRPAWSGSLKCYACWSASQLVADPHPSERPLARQLAEHLREHGFRCSVFGYEAETSSNAAGASKSAYRADGSRIGTASSVRRPF